MILNLDPTKHYGFMLSGGLDSAVLLALTLKQYPFLRITPFNIFKHDGTGEASKRITNYFGLSDPIVVGKDNVHRDLQGPRAAKEIRENHKYIDHIIYGSNRIPPIDLGLKPVWRIPSKDPYCILPFFDLYKSDIIRIAEENNFQFLYDMTHTCTEQPVGRCSCCWQCKERAWGFEQAGVIDTGTN